MNQVVKALRAALHAKEEVRSYPGRLRNTRLYKREARRAARRASRHLTRSEG